MQNLPIYLYGNTLDVILDLDSTVRGVNQVMYQRDLKIQKGIKNQVRIQFKNSDQKRVSISDSDIFVFSVYDQASQRLVIEKPLEIIESNTSTRGLALLTLSESDTVNLPRSSYNYSVRKLDADGSYVPAYTNTYYGVAGTLHLTEEVFPRLQPSQEVISFPRSFNDSTYLYEHKSGNIYAYPEYNAGAAIHTAAMYMTAFKGTVYIQGTLDNSPAQFGHYVTIDSRTYNGFSGIDYINFTGVFTYIRFMFIPAKRPSAAANDDPSYFGSFDKILYRS